MEKLSHTLDQRYALRVAIEQAVEGVYTDLYESWDVEKIRRHYDNLMEGRQTIELQLSPVEIVPLFEIDTTSALDRDRL